MEWEYLLIALYLEVCQAWDDGLQFEVKRYSNNRNPPALTDQEVLTLFLFGVLKKRRQLKEIHQYAFDHLRAWFPHLKSYQAFNYRLNRLAPFFAHFAEYLHQKVQVQPQYNELRQHLRQLDSMPIVLAKGQRASKAKVAKGLAAKGGHSSIIGGFYGVKLHALSTPHVQKMPIPEVMEVMPGNAHDSQILLQWSPYLDGFTALFGDKAYSARELVEQLEQQNIELHTPIKKSKGQERLYLFERLYSKSVSSIRQPIESFFNWIQEKTNIQQACKVRSTKGLHVHVWGRMAAAFCFLLFNP